MPNLVNDDKVWALEFRKWLKEQGAKIEHSPKGVLRNSLNVSPGFDRLVFEDDRDATMFILRWS